MNSGNGRGGGGGGGGGGCVDGEAQVSTFVFQGTISMKY